MKNICKEKWEKNNILLKMENPHDFHVVCSEKIIKENFFCYFYDMSKKKMKINNKKRLAPCTRQKSLYFGKRGEKIYNELFFFFILYFHYCYYFGYVLVIFEETEKNRICIISMYWCAFFIYYYRFMCTTALVYVCKAGVYLSM